MKISGGGVSGSGAQSVPNVLSFPSPGLGIVSNSGHLRVERKKLIDLKFFKSGEIQTGLHPGGGASPQFSRGRTSPQFSRGRTSP